MNNIRSAQVMSELDDVTLSDVTNNMIDSITILYETDRKTARRLLATALNRRPVSSRVFEMVVDLINGDARNDS